MTPFLRPLRNGRSDANDQTKAIVVIEMLIKEIQKRVIRFGHEIHPGVKHNRSDDTERDSLAGLNTYMI